MMDASLRSLFYAAVFITFSTWSSVAFSDGRVDVNNATAAQLQQLNGIGPSRAQAIIEHRERNGPFRTVDELTKVQGIGPAILERIRDHVKVGEGPPARARQEVRQEVRQQPPPPRREASTRQDLDLTREEPGNTIADRRAVLEGRQHQPAEPRAASPRRSSRHEEATPSTPTSPSSAPGNLINVNTAGEQELTRLPGIGPARASAIISHRSAQGPFRRVDDLTNVSGIGPATLNNVRNLVTIAIDLNRASLQDLEAIGIDMDAAQRLVDWRKQHGPFRSIEQLTDVPGFGRGALDTLRPFLWIEST